MLGVDSLNCWCGQDGLALSQGSWLSGSCSRKHLSSRWHWQGKWTVLHVLKLSTLSKQQTQLNTLGAYLLTSTGVSGFNITDPGLQAPGKWTCLFLRHCLSSSVNISKGRGGINGSLASQISLWREENQRPCQHWFDWFLTSETSQFSLKGLNPLDMETHTYQVPHDTHQEWWNTDGSWRPTQSPCENTLCAATQHEKRKLWACCPTWKYLHLQSPG